MPKEIRLSPETRSMIGVITSDLLQHNLLVKWSVYPVVLKIDLPDNRYVEDYIFTLEVDNLNVPRPPVKIEMTHKFLEEGVNGQQSSYILSKCKSLIQ